MLKPPRFERKREKHFMVIMAQSGKWVAEWEKISKMVVSSSQKGYAVLAIMPGDTEKTTMVSGTYANENQAILALGKFYTALNDGDKSFQFPQPEDMPVLNQSYSGRASTRRNSHGGS